ncbi:MAG TPA: FKBP-type peptidyl-prolyl cis-trans isomerase [Usitatibacter sp.]|nr:FKBP-type peptidyl-prolyl cis-trans isomerase [Usitatibacter sp.]
MKKAMIAALVAVCAAGIAFAEEAKKDDKAGCVAAPKELVVKDTKVGPGAEVVFRTPILVSYTGWLYDPCKPDHKGEMFDTSAGRATPFGFIVGAGRVIKGWDEGLIGMHEDGQRTLVIPPDKAYGEKGTPNGKIPPNSTLVFDVTLLKVLNSTPTKAPAPAPAPSAAPK